MKLSLSVNWCNRRIESGEEIADTAAALGFDELEIGFRTTASQVEGIRRRLDTVAVGSVHAFAPAPLSAPSAHPELYSLASFDAESRSMARLQILRTAEFASGIGARTVVLHAGRITLGGFLSKIDSPTLVEKLLKGGGNSIGRPYMRLMSTARRRREGRGRVMLDLFKKELSSLVPELERLGVTLALENLPYYEAFPDEREMRCLLDEFAGAPVSAWFDTGHDYIRRQCGWQSMNVAPLKIGDVRGMHLNDVSGVEDEHLAPGFGKVDFAALKSMAEAAEHIVFEPASSVSEAELAKGVAHIRALWIN